MLLLIFCVFSTRSLFEHITNNEFARVYMQCYPEYSEEHLTDLQGKISTKGKKEGWKEGGGEFSLQNRGLEKINILIKYIRTVCPGSSDPFNVVSYYIKWVTISWTYSIYNIHTPVHVVKVQEKLLCDTLLFSFMSTLSAGIGFFRNIFRI